MENNWNIYEGGIPLSRIGRELQEKRDEQQIVRLWKQIWIVMLGLITYAAVSALWGQKVLYLAIVVVTFLIIGKLNKI